jgi:hypothetical protein
MMKDLLDLKMNLNDTASVLLNVKTSVEAVSSRMKPVSFSHRVRKGGRENGKIQS